MLSLPVIIFPTQTFNEYKGDIFNCLFDGLRGNVSFRIDKGQERMRFDTKGSFLKTLFDIEPGALGFLFFYVDGKEELMGGISKREDVIALSIAHYRSDIDETKTIVAFYDHLISKVKELNIPCEAQRGHVDYM